MLSPNTACYKNFFLNYFYNYQYLISFINKDYFFQTQAKLINNLNRILQSVIASNVIVDYIQQFFVVSEKLFSFHEISKSFFLVVGL